MRIPRALMDAILAHARSGYPYEVCGVLLGRNGAGDRRVDRVVPVVNREQDSPQVRYEIAPEDLVRVQRDGRGAGERAARGECSAAALKIEKRMIRRRGVPL